MGSFGSFHLQYRIIPFVLTRVSDVTVKIEELKAKSKANIVTQSGNDNSVVIFAASICQNLFA